MKNICHNFYRKIIFNASALPRITKLMESGLGKVHMLLRIFLEKNWDLNGW